MIKQHKQTKQNKTYKTNNNTPLPTNKNKKKQLKTQYILKKTTTKQKHYNK